MAMAVDWEPWQWWVALSAFLIVVEMVSTSFYVFFFAIGAAITALVSFLLGYHLERELAVFLGASIISTWLFRPLFCQWFNITSQPSKASNVDALIGEEAKVTEPVSPDGGRIKLRQTGELWSAYTAGDHPTLSVGQTVIVQSVDGAKLCVVPTTN